jgi:hypothetical protein
VDHDFIGHSTQRPKSNVLCAFVLMPAFDYFVRFMNPYWVKDSIHMDIS